ncbi:D-glycero-D-manno-heptose 1-phosphate guanosyltransferase [Rhodopseudomonas palustris]|uniref:sugar phosphate nucleotidyltransferase n=1 Tax=Rhodopseudomonas palustris TaxID=1076 RepID=UPI000D1A1A0C|nr:sugar phosphate nucleotidyltransferase [Rhodopseudomonas palustris]AVT78119.1 D-glycero-D-manno-heptose 1-phosphate guanosyltransferase [Rhodopseudomonas palustris]
MTTAIVLAGGLGTRLRDAVPDLPKPMASVRGRPFLSHLMDYWINQGVERFVLSVGHMRERIIDHFGDDYRGVPVAYAIEEQPLGTGGGLLMGASGLSAPFLVLNGDTFFEVELSALTDWHRRQRSDWTFALFRTADTQRYMGMDVAAGGAIRSLTPRAGGPEQLANGGVYLIDPAALRAIPYVAGVKLSLEYELLPAVVERGRKLFGMESRGRFIDIGIPDDYRRAETVLP